MGKGRDKELIKLRDEALCRRYYYWTEMYCSERTSKEKE